MKKYRTFHTSHSFRRMMLKNCSKCACIAYILRFLADFCVILHQKLAWCKKPEYAFVFLFLLSSTLFAHDVLPIKRWRTPEGLEVYHVFLKEMPIVDLRLVFDAGSARDGAHPGMAYLTNRMLDQGTSHMNSTAIANAFAKLGTQYFNDSGRDYAMIGFRSLISENNRTIALFTQLLKEVNFPKQALDREKQLQLTMLSHIKQDPSALADEALYRLVYGNYPYAHGSLGNAKSVSALTSKQLKAFYKKHYSHLNGRLIIVGSLQEQQARIEAEKISHVLSHAAKQPPLPPIKQVKTGLKRHLNFPAKQMQIRLAQIGIDRKNPDYYALQVANYVLGGGTLVSRLMESIREKNGLAYSVYSQFYPMRSKGLFLIALATRQEESKKALSLVKKVVSDYVKTGPTEKELAAAKAYLTGSFPIRLHSNKAITDQIMSMAFYDLPEQMLDEYVDRIHAVTLADVRRVLKSYIQPQRFAQVTVGQQSLQ